jgi:hypothetical protein
VQAAPLGRYPAEVEATVYFCCLEAIHNAGKHAGAGATLAVRVWEEGPALAFDVTDDGSGFDAVGRGLGAGFTNMEDRLCALRGSLRVESAPGRGTRVSGQPPATQGGGPGAAAAHPHARLTGEPAGLPDQAGVRSDEPDDQRAGDGVAVATRCWGRRRSLSQHGRRAVALGRAASASPPPGGHAAAKGELWINTTQPWH